MAHMKNQKFSLFECHMSNHGGYSHGGQNRSGFTEGQSGVTNAFNHEGSHTSHVGFYRSHQGSYHNSHYGGSANSQQDDFRTIYFATPQLSKYKCQRRSPSAHERSTQKGEKQTSIGYVYGVGNVHSTHKNGNYLKRSVDLHGSMHDGLFHINEKETMQLLNDRLATYMEKVQSLEQGNSQLENKINDWYTKNAPRSLPDSRPYLSTIQDLQTQIIETTVKNGSISLEVDNAKWAADDFKNKYDIELRLKDSVERDVKGLRQALAWLKMETNDLEIQVQNLQEEDQEIKKNHEQEVTALKSQMGQRVNVEVDAAPSRDLNKTLDEIRQQYENLMERNLKEVESMFLARSEDLNRQVVSASEQLQSVQTVNIDLKRKVQTLEIDLESQRSMNAALEDSLAETEATYSSQLHQIQKMINQMEAELSEIRYDMERQNSEYKKLMDQKTHLEMEIATYKRLLEGNNIKGKKENVTFSTADKMKSSTVSLSNTDEQDKKISSVTEDKLTKLGSKHASPKMPKSSSYHVTMTLTLSPG
ncbi:keratin, type I cytoskeletal 19-like [Pelobates fuscus]|uniref:keratin, type I cytoskeletal 19-like n=1 Tax=Pelobates fuscus TaxID=191477 RepID=UPI002FE48085